MQKKGQTTLFVILGIMFILAIILYTSSLFFLKTNEQVKQQVVEIAVDQPIKAFVTSCVEQTAKLALFFFGFIGGTPSMYESYFSYDEHYKIPYLYTKGKTTYLTPDFVQNALEQSVTTKLQKCTGTFSPFSGVSVTDVAPQTKVLLLDNEVAFSVTYPITVTRDGKKSVVGPDFSTRIPLRLKDMVKITNDIVAQKQQDPSLIHWDYLTEVTKREYNATAYAEVDETLIYRLVDEKYELLGEPYIFQFAVKIG